VRDKVATRCSRNFTRTMKIGLLPEDRLTLTVWRASGEAGMFEVSETELKNLLSPHTVSD
jgi:hypothetical protein